MEGLQWYHPMDKFQKNAYNSLKDNNDDIAVSLATAHPAKFSKAVHDAININPTLPLKYKNIFRLKESFQVIENNYKIQLDFVRENLRKYVRGT